MKTGQIFEEEGDPWNMVMNKTRKTGFWRKNWITSLERKCASRKRRWVFKKEEWL